MSRHLKVFILLFCFVLQATATERHDIHLKNIAQQILLLTDQKVLFNKKIVELKAEMKSFKKNPPESYQEVAELKNRIDMRTSITDILVEELSNSLANAQQRSTKAIEYQKNLQVQLLNAQSEEEKKYLTEKLAFAVELVKLNQREIDLLDTDLALANQLKSMYQQYLTRCLTLMDSIDKSKKIQLLLKQVTEEQKMTDYWLSKINELYQKKNELTPTSLSEQIVNESHLFYYTQQVHLSGIKVIILETTIQERKLAEEFNILKKDVNSNAKINLFKDTLDEEGNTLKNATISLEQYQSLIKKQEELLQNALRNKWLKSDVAQELKRNIQELEDTADYLKEALMKKQEIIENMQKEVQDYTSQMVAKRQALLKTDETVVLGFLQQFAALPKFFITYLNSLWEQTWQGILLISIWFKMLILIVFVISGYIWWIGKKYFSVLSQKMSGTRQRTSSNLVYILLELLRRNWGTLCLFLNIWFLLNTSGINFDAYLGPFYTTIIWLIFRTIMGVARIILVERGNDTQGHDVRLYYRLKWVFIIGGWVTVLLVFSKQFEMGEMLFEVANRLFMGFLLMISIVLIRARNVIPNMLDPIFLSRKYLSRTIRAVCWIMPYGFFISTILGICGYINLSWLLIYYQASLVLIVATYIILRGIASDLFEVSSEIMIRKMSQGWLWSEAFLKPLDYLCRFFLFISMIVGVFLVLGWHNDSLVVTKMREIFHYSFFNFSGIDVSPINLIEFIALVSFCFWMAKWTREFAYRWVFRNAKDVGIRHSLAVFSQYIVITIGIIVTLRVLGIDFSGLSMILGGLAVGLGFGLRDFASNIVGGIMLLIERSVKEGDIVSVGTYEGEVTHIGIRAMRLRSWDHMEIMVPNSEILMKTFVNWTHQNSIVRTVIPMKIHPVDDPIIVQKMILDLLKKLPEILLEPHAEVFFTNINTGLIEFEIRYFINISLHLRSEVRSKILTKIIDAFKEAGLRPPYSQQDSYVWEVHNEGNVSYEKKMMSGL